MTLVKEEVGDISPSLMEANDHDEINIMNNKNNWEPLIQEGNGVRTQGQEEADIPPSIPQVVLTSRMASNFCPSLFRDRSGELRGLVEKTMSKGNPLKGTRIDSLILRNYLILEIIGHLRVRNVDLLMAGVVRDNLFLLIVNLLKEGETYL